MDNVWLTADTKEPVHLKNGPDNRTLFLLSPHGGPLRFTEVFSETFKEFRVGGDFIDYISLLLADNDLSFPLSGYISGDIKQNNMSKFITLMTDSFYRDIKGNEYVREEIAGLACLLLSRKDCEPSVFHNYESYISVGGVCKTVNQHIANKTLKAFSLYGLLDYPFKFSFDAGAEYENMPPSEKCSHEEAFIEDEILESRIPTGKDGASLDTLYSDKCFSTEISFFNLPIPPENLDWLKLKGWNPTVNQLIYSKGFSIGTLDVNGEIIPIDDFAQFIVHREGFYMVHNAKLNHVDDDIDFHVFDKQYMRFDNQEFFIIHHEFRAETKQRLMEVFRNDSYKCILLELKGFVSICHDKIFIINSDKAIDTFIKTASQFIHITSEYEGEIGETLLELLPIKNAAFSISPASEIYCGFLAPELNILFKSGFEAVVDYAYLQYIDTSKENRGSNESD